MSLQDHISTKRGLFYFVVFIAIVFGLQLGWFYHAWLSELELLLPVFLVISTGLMLFVFTLKALKP